MLNFQGMDAQKTCKGVESCASSSFFIVIIERSTTHLDLSGTILPTMRKPLIAGNWKMHGSKASVDSLLQALVHSATSVPSVELAVFPPFVFLEQTSSILSGSGIHWGAQNVSDQESGAYTGEVSVKMLKEFGCRYVIVGHSERRTLLGETNEMVAAKFKTSLQAGVTPILCVGESEQEREKEETFTVIKKQLAAVFGLLDNLPRLAESVVAYEPIWAIGTGRNATPEQAQEVHAFIRNELNVYLGHSAQTMRILYGGSVKPANSAALLAKPDIDGALVGGASLEAKSFLEIAQCKHSF